MKLIIEHQYGDGCTYEHTDTIPIEYESSEQLICDMEEWAKKENNSKTLYCHGWGGFGIEPNTILRKAQYMSIDIYTLEEWFELNKARL